MKTFRSLFVIAAIVVLLTGCHDRKYAPPSLIATDKEFSRMSVEEGLNAAFIAYAADSVVKVREGNFPITGKDTMTQIYLSNPDTGVILKWYPVKAEVAASGDLGYTFGNWEMYLKAKDTTMYGNYITIWRLQPDGTWKYILDTGNNTPKPNTLIPGL